MPKTITLKLYTFEELDQDAKDRVLADLRYINVEGFDWWDVIYDQWIEKLAKLGYERPNFLWSGFYSQGDGASFEADIDILKWLKATRRKVSRKLRKYVKDGELTAKIERSRGMSYVHENMMDARLYGNWDGLEDDMDKLEQDFTNGARYQATLLYADLKKEYEYRTADERVIETIDANEWTFEKDGKMRNA